MEVVDLMNVEVIGEDKIRSVCGIHRTSFCFDA